MNSDNRPLLLEENNKKRNSLFEFDLKKTRDRIRFFFFMALIALLCYFPGDLLYNNGMQATGIMLWIIGGMCGMAMWIVPLWVTLMDDNF